MDKILTKRTIVFQAALVLCFILAGSSYAQNVKYLEKRVAALEERVRKLELQLDKALNPAKYKKAARQKKSTKQQVRKLSPVESPLRAKLFNKKLKTAEPGETDDNLAFLISFENDGAVGVISLKGEIIFKDTYGDSIMSFEADIKKPIPAGKNNTWFGGVVYDASNTSHRKILNMDIKNIVLELRLERVAFSDGTIKEAKKEE
jgi:hypothetical protein